MLFYLYKMFVVLLWSGLIALLLTCKPGPCEDSKILPRNWNFTMLSDLQNDTYTLPLRAAKNVILLTDPDSENLISWNK